VIGEEGWGWGWSSDDLDGQVRGGDGREDAAVGCFRAVAYFFGGVGWD